jgi:hypothetical protein
MFALYGVGDGIVGGPMLSTAISVERPLRWRSVCSPANRRPQSRRPCSAMASRPTTRASCGAGTFRSPAPAGQRRVVRQPTTWERNRGIIALGALLGVISVVAIVLFVGVMRQRRAQGRSSGANAVLTPPADAAELSNLSRHLIQEHERERAALAKTLHDDVGQRIVALTLRLQSLQGPAHDAEVAEIRETLSSLVAEIATASDPSMCGSSTWAWRLQEGNCARSYPPATTW